MLSNLAFLVLLAAQMASARFVMYFDEYHHAILPDRNVTSGIDHVVISAAKSTVFTTDPPGQFGTFMPVEEVADLFDEGTKVLIAIGAAWGDTAGFSIGAANETSRAIYAKNVAALLDFFGVDGVDIDWVYPGGNNGDGDMKIPNSEKVSEIESFSLLLEEIRAAIGPSKILSIAVPGKDVDQIAFTPKQASKIWESVDFVNLMTYDLMDRRNNATTHHTGIANSLEAVNNFIDLGLDPQKMNLGFAYYAKWFTTSPYGDCESNPIGCPTALLENPDGTDTGNSGTMTFEKANMALASKNLPVSENKACGAAVGTRCEEGMCCSQIGTCGETKEHCGLTCLPGYGDCAGPTVTSSWFTALQNSETDIKGGGEYYWDPKTNLFWTWDTTELIAAKFEKIIAEKGIGGVMAWSLGQDSATWEHIAAMKEGLEKSGGKKGRLGGKKPTTRLFEGYM